MIDDIRSWVLFCLFFRWWKTSAADSVWRSGHSSYGSLLDRTAAQCLRVKFPTHAHRQVSLVKYMLGRDLSHSFTRLRHVQYWCGCGDGVPGLTLRPHENDQICRSRETCGEVSTFNQELLLSASRLNRIDSICIVIGFLKAISMHSKIHSTLGR